MRYITMLYGYPGVDPDWIKYTIETLLTSSRGHDVQIMCFILEEFLPLFYQYPVKLVPISDNMCFGDAQNSFLDYLRLDQSLYGGYDDTLISFVEAGDSVTSDHYSPIVSSISTDELSQCPIIVLEPRYRGHYLRWVNQGYSEGVYSGVIGGSIWGQFYWAPYILSSSLRFNRGLFGSLHWNYVLAGSLRDNPILLNKSSYLRGVSKDCIQGMPSLGDLRLGVENVTQELRHYSMEYIIELAARLVKKVGLKKYFTCQDPRREVPDDYASIRGTGISELLRVLGLIGEDIDLRNFREFTDYLGTVNYYIR